MNLKELAARVETMDAQRQALQTICQAVIGLASKEPMFGAVFTTAVNGAMASFLNAKDEKFIAAYKAHLTMLTPAQFRELIG